MEQKLCHCKLRNTENIAKYTILSKQRVSRFLDIRRVTPHPYDKNLPASSIQVNYIKKV